MKRFILLDTHAIIHRAYHALPPLTSPKGEVVGAVYGFTSILLRMFRELKPDYIAAAFDLAGPTFRHIAYEHYKATRPETPSDLAPQFSFVREILDAFKIPIIQKEGFEADDIIGSLAKKFEKEKDIEIIVVTGDADTLQLVRPRLKVYSMRKGITDIVIYDEKAVRERFGFPASQLIDYKALKGDPSDNIKGVKGIGEKGATDLIKKYGSIEALYRALKKPTKKISEGLRKKLLDGVKDAEMSKELSTIHTRVPIEMPLESARARAPEENLDIPRVMERFGFASLLKRMNGNAQKPVEKKDPPASLFSSAPQSMSFERIDSPQKLAGLAKDALPESVGVYIHEKKCFVVFKSTDAIYEIDSKIISSKEGKAFFAKGFLAYDGKVAIHFLQNLGVRPGRILFDLKIASYLTSAVMRDFSMAALLARDLGREGGSDPAVFGSAFFHLGALYEAKLKEGKIGDIFRDIEMPLVPVLARMEDWGILIDSASLRALSEEVAKKIKELTKNILSLAGEDFNINSTQQLSRILFEKLEIGTKGLKKTGKSGKISTRESELEKLAGAHPIIASILAYRELNKLQSTYIDVLPGLVNPKTGRIHTTFNQTVAATGRLSSQDPNIQNIPIMSDYGKKIRESFVAAPGFVLASFDYSQIELRVAAHMASDKKMIEAFKKGIDIHALTASEVYNVPLASVTPDLRRAAKTLNFGILYGMGPQALSEGTGMTKDEARAFIDEYFKDFSGIARFIQETKEFAEANGYVETLFGRRRYIPEIHSQNWQDKREAERMAVNMPIQGTATGDIVKRAMIQIDEWVRKENKGDTVRMLLQVHDELLFEIKKEYADEAKKKIKELMESAATLVVPLVVDVSIGPNWGK